MFSKRYLTPPSDIVPVFAAGTAIPKVIHQTYPDAHRNLPSILEQNVRKITALNPGWEHRLYDDNDIASFIDSTYGARVLDYYNRLNEKYGAARADLFRYLLLYRHGGVYLDIKASLERPLDSVLHPDDVYLLSRWRNRKGEQYEGWGIHSRLRQIGRQEFQQWHIIAAPGHPFLRAVIQRVLHNIDSYSPAWDDTGRSGVLGLTGPIAYTLAITPLLDQYPHRLVSSHDELGLVYSIFTSAVYEAHKSVFKYHYTDLTEPVVKVSGARKLLWRIAGPIQIHIIHRAQHLIEAIGRRLQGRRDPRRHN
jgi:inositol phosphorylceramide mannosyltransferase catalytic subunit